MNINESITGLIVYGIQTGILNPRDKTYAINLIIDALGLDFYEETQTDCNDINLERVLEQISDYAIENGIIEDSIVFRDLFDTKIMSYIMPRPSEVTEKFFELYHKSPKEATEYFYKLSCDSNYIRKYRIEKDIKWIYQTPYGDMDITINLSKPEKDPKAIAASKKAPQNGYPKCMLCRENEGYAGRVNYPARQNHRIIPVTINQTEWFMQYSPYVYYNEHCIVFNSEHVPMKIDKSTFRKLFDFVAMFPHYFVGSNADLPIVGGSILSHDHFQGGNYEFAMAKAPIEHEISFDGFEDVEAGIVKWPMSTIRLRSKSIEQLVNLSDKILQSWRSYTDKDSFIFAQTNGEAHNTITPIARMKNEKYEIDLVLRNNITTDEHPLGVYHPHAELHNIKKENIGLIEVMGLAVLPARLNTELDLLSEALINKRDIDEIPEISKHKKWADMFSQSYPDINRHNVDDIIRAEVGKVFQKVLEHCGVFKCNDNGRKAFLRFIERI